MRRFLKFNRNITILLIFFTLFLFADCKRSHKRPWKNESQELKFMIKMTSDLVAPVPDRCIDELHDRLRAEKSGFVPGPSKTRAAGFHPAFPGAQIILTQESDKSRSGSGCEAALASCGACHLPAVNNCRYDITAEVGNGKTFVHRNVLVESFDGTNLMVGGLESRPVKIPAKKVVKSVWLNGADPLHAWWNFDAFGKRGETAHKMLELATTYRVGCANCHLKHGDFRLTKEGKVFYDTEKVIRKVPLHTMLK